MSYLEYVLDVFRDHADCIGQDMEEINDIIEESSLHVIEKWLTKIGYDLNEYHLNID